MWHEDQKYVNGLAENNAALINEIYQKYSANIKLMVTRNNGSEADAADVFQEVLLWIYKNAKNRNFVLTCPLDAFLYVACKNKWITELKRRKPGKVTIDDSGLYNINEDCQKLAEEFKLHSQRQELLTEKLAELGKDCRKLLELNWSGKPMQEAHSKKTAISKRAGIAAAVISIVALSMLLYLKNENNTTISKRDKTPDIVNKVNKPAAPSSNNNISDTNIAKSDKADFATDHDVLFADNFRPDATPSVKEGPLENAFKNYENRKYKDAIAAINNANLTVITRGEENDQTLDVFYASYYQALSYMALQNMKKAIQHLKVAVLASPDTLLKIKAQWYLSLAYIKTTDYNKAVELLRQIVNSKNENTSVYKTKAKKLLLKLKQLN